MNHAVRAPGTIGAPAGPPAARAQVVLLASVFAVAACGLVYELVLGALASYVLGDAVTQFSVVVGVFLCAMGGGAYLARFVTRDPLRVFVELEVWIGTLGGGTSIALFAVNAFAEAVFRPVFYLLCATLGVLVGIEIPLLVRLIGRARPVADAVSEVLALDYLGALVGSLAFPFLALPYLGLSRASLVFGLMNLAVAAAGVTLLPPPRRGLVGRLGAAIAILSAALVYSLPLVGFLEDLLYQDDVVLVRQSRHQRIVITRWRDDVRLYLDGHLQFSAVDEARYHEALIFPALAAVPAAADVLVLGGGDGLAAKVLLEHPGIRAVTVVDLDPDMTALARRRPELVALNGGAFDDPRVRLVHGDAFAFVRDDTAFYDVVVADLPDPNASALAKLYSTAFFASAARRLRPHGVFVTQATSPYYARQAFWSIVVSMEQAVSEGGRPGWTVHPYHLNVPSFGEWGFALASARPLDPRRLRVPQPSRALTDETLRAMFVFDKDIDRVAADPNRLDAPVLHRYYEEGWRRFNL